MSKEGEIIAHSSDMTDKQCDDFIGVNAIVDSDTEIYGNASRSVREKGLACRKCEYVTPKEDRLPGSSEGWGRFKETPTITFLWACPKCGKFNARVFSVKDSSEIEVSWLRRFFFAFFYD